MKTLRTLFVLVLIVINAAPALAATPYERAASYLRSVNDTVVTTNKTTTTTNTTCVDLTTNLSIADKGTKASETLKLQAFLYPKYLKEPPTGYFGVLTDAAVKQFQAEYGLAPVAGYTGPLTRSKIKEVTCGSTAQAASTAVVKSGTTASTGSLASTYNPNAAWWLSPAPTAQTTPTTKPADTTGTNDIGNTSTTGGTTATPPPTNCDQYAGVLPNESRKARVVQKQFDRPYTDNYPGKGIVTMSPEAQQQLNLLYDDVGYVTFTSKLRPVTIPSGQIYSYPMKTTEYNMPVWQTIEETLFPGSSEGIVAMSVSECPGDFTSPAVLSQASGYDPENVYGDNKRRNCVTMGAAGYSTINFGVGGNAQYLCSLEPNKTYYFNVSGGFVAEPDDINVPNKPFIDSSVEGQGGQSHVSYFHGMRYTNNPQTETGTFFGATVEKVKNRSAFYEWQGRLFLYGQAAGSQ